VAGRAAAFAVLILATIADLAVALLLVAVSGFVVGTGPESMHADSVMVSAWVAIVIFCLAAPVGGFVLRVYRRPGTGAVLAWLPPLVVLAAVSLPPPY